MPRNGTKKVREEGTSGTRNGHIVDATQETVAEEVAFIVETEASIAKFEERVASQPATETGPLQRRMSLVLVMSTQVQPVSLQTRSSPALGAP